MASDWVPVRMIRWPAQQADRDWCAARGVPRVLLVTDGPAPQAAADDREIVLVAPISQDDIQDAVERLSRVTAAPACATRVPAPSARPLRPARPRLRLAAVAALF